MFAALIPILGPIIEKVIGAAIPDPEARAKAVADFYAQLSTSDLAQMEVNKAEAMTGGDFRSGWRPFIGWVCGSALAYQYIIAPIGLWAASWANLDVPPPPALDSMLWELMFGMLGMGALRSLEKLKALAK